MPDADLLETVLTNGIRDTNFFNGRVVTADDMRTLQRAARERDAQLGLALGEGVVHGLDVKRPLVASVPASGETHVTVTRGLAINREGTAVALGADTTVALVPLADVIAADEGAFARCEVTSSATLESPGLYVLTIAPATGYEGRALMTELGTEGIGTQCGRRYEVNGATFRLVRLEAGEVGAATGLRGRVATLAAQVEAKIVQRASLTGSAAAAKAAEIVTTLSFLRNAAAYLCFGVEEGGDVAASPFPRADGTVPGAAYGALDALRAQRALKPCEVPLALLYWSRRGIEFIDWWSVRRPLVPAPVLPTMSPADSRRRRAEALAMVLQFQQQLDDLRAQAPTQTGLAAVRAKDCFLFLPPCGVIPVLGAGAQRSFTSAEFFRDLAIGQPTAVAPAQVERLFAEGLLNAPVDLARRGMLQLYAPPAPAGSAPPQPYVLYVTREAHGPLEDDEVVQTLQEAWDAYRGLVRQRAFLPREMTEDGDAARVTILAALQDVMAVASQKAALAAARQLDFRAALGAFQALYAVQHDLAALLAGSITGIGDVQNRAAFAADLNRYLDTASPDHGLALGPALQQQDLIAAIAAQGGINRSVGQRSGEGVAMGVLRFTPEGSPDGSTLVLPGNAGPALFHFRFALHNDTDRQLTIDVGAAVSGLAGDWVGALPAGNAAGGAVEVQAEDGTPLRQVAVGRYASAMLVVVVKVPSGATAGTGSLEITAHVGAPHNRDAQLGIPITTGTAGTPAVTRFVTLVPSAVSPTTDVPIAAGASRQWTFVAAYDGPAGTTADFVLTVEGVGLPNNTARQWAIVIVGDAAPQTAFDATSKKVTSSATTIADGSDWRPRVKVTAPSTATAGHTLDLMVRVESTDAVVASRIAAAPLTWKLTVS